MAGAFDDGLPVLLDYQQRWAAEPAEIAVVEKSRRIGLSWGDAAERAIYAGTEGGAGGNVTYMSYNKDMTELYIGDCADWARRYQQAVSDVLDETIVSGDEQYQRFRIRFDAGHQIVALASNPRVLRSRGKPGDIAVIDEAAFCDDLDALLKAATAITMWGGRVRIVSTHNGDESAFNQLVNEVRAGRPPDYVVHRVTLDDAIAQGLARRICTVRGERYGPDYDDAFRARVRARYRDRDEMLEELYCVPMRGGGRWLSRVLVESRMAPAPIVRFEGDAEFNALSEPRRREVVEEWLGDEAAPALATLDRSRRHVMGMDFARSGDMSVVAPLEVGATLRRTCPFLVEMHNVPHEQQAQAVAYVCDRLPRFGGGAMDASGNGSYVAEKTEDRYGTLIEKVMPSIQWYRERCPPYKAALEDDRITLPRHDDVLDDHRAFMVLDGVPRLPKGKTDTKGRRHGDAAMALILAWQASTMDAGPYEYIPVRPGRDLDDVLDEHGPGRWRDDEIEPGWGAFAPHRGGVRGVM